MTNLARILCFSFFISLSMFVFAGAPSAQDATPSDDTRKVIVFFGDSLTAGYGVDAAQAFPALIQKKIDAQGWKFHAVNAGVSGETTGDGLQRIDRVLQRPLDVFVLELGANDGLRGIDPEVTRRNLQAIIERVKAKYPQAKIILAGMQIPSNLGRDHVTRFREIFPEVAEASDVALIPFLLEGVGGKAKLNFPDGIHPTPEGYRIVAENVWTVLEPMLKAMQ